MLTLYHNPRTRSVRVRWLLEELGIPHELKRQEFTPPTRFFEQETPLGKFPVLEDGETLICESGAIVEYLLERYAEGRLAPAIASPQRGEFLQWVHYAEGTLFPPLGIIVWRTRYQGDADAVEAVIEDATLRAHRSLQFVEERLADRDYILGDEFSAADIMLGFSVVVAKLLGVLDDRYVELPGYVERLEARPALQRARAD